MAIRRSVEIAITVWGLPCWCGPGRYQSTPFLSESHTHPTGRPAAAPTSHSPAARLQSATSQPHARRPPSVSRRTPASHHPPIAAPCTPPSAAPRRPPSAPCSPVQARGRGGEGGEEVSTHFVSTLLSSACLLNGQAMQVQMPLSSNHPLLSCFCSCHILFIFEPV